MISAAQSRRLAKYGLSEAEYTALLIAQSNRCAICSVEASESSRRLAIDHDHATGQNRGILCFNCNAAIGLLRDDPVYCRRAAQYLENPPAQQPLRVAAPTSFDDDFDAID